MANRAMVPTALAAFSTEIARREGARFWAAVLFGSHARGEDSEDSDVDVAVIFTEMANSLIEEKLALADIAYDILLETGVLIQALPLSEDQWHHPNHHSNPDLIENIHRDGIKLER